MATLKLRHFIVVKMRVNYLKVWTKKKTTQNDLELKTFTSGRSYLGIAQPCILTSKWPKSRNLSNTGVVEIKALGEPAD